MVVCHCLANRHGWYCFRGRPTAPRPDRFEHARLRNPGLAWYLVINRYRVMLNLVQHNTGEEASIDVRPCARPTRLRFLRLPRRTLGDGPTLQRTRYMDQI